MGFRFVLLVLLCASLFAQTGVADVAKKPATDPFAKAVGFAAFSPDNQFIIALIAPNTVVTWSVATGHVQSRITIPGYVEGQDKGWVEGLDTLSNPQRLVVVISDDPAHHHLEYYDLQSGALLSSEPAPTPLYRFDHSFLENHCLLDKGSDNSSVTIENLQTHESRVLHLPFPIENLYDGFQLYLAGSKQTVAYVGGGLRFLDAGLHRYSKETFAGVFFPEPDLSGLVSLDDAGDKAAAIQFPGWLRLYDTKTGNNVQIDDPYDKSLANWHTGVAMSPTGDEVAVADFDGLVHVYSTSTRKVLIKHNFASAPPPKAATGPRPYINLDFQLAITELRYSPDGKTLFIGLRTGEAYLWNIETGAVEQLASGTGA